jgi:predicted PurR-regulated permease PerM
MKNDLKQHKLFFYGLLGLTAFGAYKILSSYIPIILLAIICSILLYPVYEWLRKTTKWRPIIVSTITISGALLLIGIPLVKTASSIVSEVSQFSYTNSFQSNLKNLKLNTALESINTTIAQIPGTKAQLTEVNITEYISSASKPISSFLLDKLVTVGASSASFVSSFFIFIILLFTILPVVSKMRRYIEKLSPLPDKIDRLYLDRATAMTIAMMKGTILIAILQGISAGFLLLIVGVDYILTLTLVMIFLSIIPVVGTTIITLPIGIYLLITGNIIGGLILILGQLLIISNIDNVLRPQLVSKKAQLHPILLLLGVFGGIRLFGFFGFIYGPVIMILFVTSLEIYLKHYR